MSVVGSRGGVVIVVDAVGGGTIINRIQYINIIIIDPKRDSFITNLWWERIIIYIRIQYLWSVMLVH